MSTNKNQENAKKILDDSAEKNRNLLIALNILFFTLLVLTLSITDYQLLTLATPLPLPLLNLGLPLRVFGLVAALLVLVLHFVLLYNLVEHCQKLSAWRGAVSQTEKGVQTKESAQTVELFPSLFDFAYLRWHGKQAKGLIGVTWWVYGLLPLAVLLALLVKFSSLQEWPIFLLHALALVADVCLLNIYWRKPNFWGRADGNSNPSNHSNKTLPRWFTGIVLFFPLLLLWLYALWFMLTFGWVQWVISNPAANLTAFEKSHLVWLAKNEPKYLKWLPRLNVPRQRVTQLNEEFFKIYAVLGVTQKDIKDGSYSKIIREQGINVAPPPDLSGRSFAFANFERSEFLGLNIDGALFYGAQLNQADFCMALGSAIFANWQYAQGSFKRGDGTSCQSQSEKDIFSQEVASRDTALTEESLPTAANTKEQDVQNALNKRYQIVAGGKEVFDTQTKLTWQRCSVGQSWNGRTCEGEAKEFTFSEAQSLAKDGWRVPTVRELFSLIDCPGAPQTPVPSSWSIATEKTIDDQAVENQLRRWCGADTKSGPYINTPAFPNTSKRYWTSSPYVGSSSGAWVVDFYDGSVYNDGRSYSYQVRLVRASQ